MSTMSGVGEASAATGQRTILTINAGSSSVRCAVYALGKPLRRLLAAQVDRIGSPHAVLDIPIGAASLRRTVRIPVADHRAAVAVRWTGSRPSRPSPPWQRWDIVSCTA